MAGRTYIDGEFSADPHQLGSVRLQLAYAAVVRLDGMDGTGAQRIDGFQVAGEHVRVLVIFAGDVLLDGIGERDGVGAAEGQVEDVAAQAASVLGGGGTRSSLRTRPWVRYGGREEGGGCGGVFAAKKAR